MTWPDDVPEDGPIDSLYAAIAEGPDGDELVRIISRGVSMPLVVRGQAGLDVMLGRLQRIADHQGQTVRAVKFVRDGIAGEFRPGG